MANIIKHIYKNVYKHVLGARRCVICNNIFDFQYIIDLLAFLRIKYALLVLRRKMLPGGA